ncbi:MAG: hypothetical protein ACYC54_15010 [Sedimentisphaerales bacterium]
MKFTKTQLEKLSNQQIVREIVKLENELLKRVQQKNNSDDCNCSHSEKYDFTSILSTEYQTVLCLNCGGSIQIKQN